MKNVKVIFLDAGGTLFRPYPSVGAIYSKIAAKHGVVLSAERLDQSFHDAWHSRNGLAALAGASSEKVERDWWHGLVQEVFSQLATFEDFESFFVELYDVFARKECWRLFDDTLPLLETLKNRGYRIGMISNWDHRLFGIVDDLGIEPYFEHVFASSKVGVAKPGAGIFQQAIQAFDIDPQNGVHIGDSLEEDYHGARRCGLHAVLLDRPRKAYNGVVRIESLHELIPLLS